MTDACAICTGTLGPVILKIAEPDRFERHVGIAADGYRRAWIACEDCGSATDVYSDGGRRRLADIASGYYEVDFSGSSIAAKFERVMSMPRSESDNAHRVDRVLWFLEEWGFASRNGGPVRVLDIGAGTGVFLAKFLEQCATRGLQIDAVGVEPDPKAAEHLRSLRRFRVVEGLFTPQLGLSDFSLCTLNKVLEHIPDPIGLLGTIAHALSPQAGVLYVEVPDVLTAHCRPASDNVLGALHHHLYTAEGLMRLAHRAGLETLQINRVFEPSGKISFGAFLASQATVQRLAGGQ
ncbi:MAG TPA: class I SAM-dependent methyltransferase [Steroidobacteraceae bacterium]|nr:class I SAM-dependent methyltransferase [Steroidobacteraceae bacterium]